MTIDDVVREHVSKILRECRGNKTSAAKILGTSRRSIYRYLKSWNMPRWFGRVDDNVEEHW